MDNVIRPTFRRTEAEAPPETVDAFSPLQVYGTAVGHFVALIRAKDEKVGMTLQLIVGREGGDNAESVAIFPDTAEGEADAETTGFAILRTLEIVREAFVGDAG
ncbi:hypothetical protein [Methylobacterium sp. J-067]|uniref:hypothetical protein n=1 Tax=Methylobacterium sp. J-067 TaxID=2836648 RepID=UPI001FB8DB08|nr:hypothetical protein [Methylobacterium sp. J-067]MCJ2023130.1 hypothetical protein [Methylobacterium sp. J-067]